METTHAKKSKLDLNTILAFLFLAAYLIINWSRFYAGILEGLKDFAR